MENNEKIVKKVKLIFLLEYLAISVVLLLVGFLRMFDVIPYDQNRLLVYNILTIIGVAYVFFDTIWFALSKKKRERSDLIDKIFPIPLAIFLLVFDILVLSKVYATEGFVKYSISSILIYAGLFSLFLGIYHHFKPSKLVLSAIEEEIAKTQEEQQAENQDNNNINK